LEKTRQDKIRLHAERQSTKIRMHAIKILPRVNQEMDRKRQLCKEAESKLYKAVEEVEFDSDNGGKKVSKRSRKKIVTKRMIERGKKHVQWLERQRNDDDLLSS
jgi:hypothetical protein